MSIVKRMVFMKDGFYELLFSKKEVIPYFIVKKQINPLNLFTLTKAKLF